MPFKVTQNKDFSLQKEEEKKKSVKALSGL